MTIPPDDEPDAPPKRSRLNETQAEQTRLSAALQASIRYLHDTAETDFVAGKAYGFERGRSARLITKLRRAVLLLSMSRKLKFVPRLLSRAFRAALRRRDAGREDTETPSVGWYGPNRLANNKRYGSVELGSHGAPAFADLRPAAENGNARWAIADEYSDGDEPRFVFAPRDDIRRHFAATLPFGVPSVPTPSYALVTRYCGHRECLLRAARSVAALTMPPRASANSWGLEWLVVGDDATLPMEECARIAGVAVSCRALGDGSGDFPLARDAVSAGGSERWLVFVDCDAELTGDALDVIEHYIRTFAHCRYICATAADIDAGGVLNARRHGADPTRLFEADLVARRVVAVRADLVAALGDDCSGLSDDWDYAFALRVARQEPLLLIPECLSRYPVSPDHPAAQYAKSRDLALAATRHAFAASFVAEKWPATRKARPPSVANASGLCIVRTQGKRLDLLREALESIVSQTARLRPCVVVHGDDATTATVADLLRSQPSAILLTAPDLHKRRGYPINVGLDYLRANSEAFPVFCFLDDDDIFYPTFADRMLRAMSITGADVVCCRANKRVPWRESEVAGQLRPGATLVAGNFIASNGFIARTELLLRSGARAREDMTYLEDWDLLVGFLRAGASFHFVDEVHSEFRITGDGSIERKRDPEHFRECAARVLAHGARAAATLGPGYFYRSVAQFNFGSRPPLTREEWLLLEQSRNIFAAGGEVGDREVG